MSETQIAAPATRNPAAIALVAFGGLFVVLGATLWIVGANLLKHDQMVADYTRAFGLDAGVDLAATSPQIDADQALIWWGIAILILGVILVVARVVIAAARR